MSATAVASQQAVSSASSLLASGSNTDIAEASSDGEGGFSSVFKQLLSKQGLNSGTMSPVDLLKEISTAEKDSEGTEQLSAVLPFLDALGFTPPSPVVEGSAVQSVSVPNATNNDRTSATPSINADLPLHPASSAAQIDVSDNTVAPPSPSTLTSPESETGTSILTQTKDVHDRGQNLFETTVSANQDAMRNDTHLNAHNLSLSQSNQAFSISDRPSLNINQPVGTQGWESDIGNHVVWMANRQENRADLVLTPPQMGRIEVSVTVSGDQATATFVSGNPVVREALETALPRLRETLADAGIQLSQAQVGSENSQQSAYQEKSGDNSPRESRTTYFSGTQQVLPACLPTSTNRSGVGLVDVFA